MRTVIPLLLVVALSLSVSAGHAREPRLLYVQPSALLQVVGGLRRAPGRLHRDFAYLALEAMAQAYEQELGAAVQGAPRENGLARWRQATATQLRELDQARAWLSLASEVSVGVDRQGQIMLLIDGRPVLLSWPRPKDQDRREAELVQRFCAFHRCDEVQERGSARMIQQADDVSGAWSFSQDRRPGWESESGVRCEYPDLRDREARESQCRRLATELETLARVLAEVRREGGDIQWQALRVEMEPGSGPQRVIVNAQEDYVLLPLHALAHEPVDWRAAGRWLERRTRGQRTSTETVLPALRQ